MFEAFGPAFWGFNLAIVLLLVLDLVSTGRHGLSIRSALLWSGFWIALALGFNFWVYRSLGADAGLEFLTAYVVEKSLSVDNLFVFLLIFSSFQVPAGSQHRVLFLGILGALILRVIFIFAGIELLHRFHWLMFVFGGILIFTGLKMLKKEDSPADVQQRWLVRTLARVLPLWHQYEGNKFWILRYGKLYLTPLALVLLVIEGTDVVFALDSIPAVLAISDDFFIVYTSNIFAILGLRSLYFALSGLLGLFRYLHYGLAAILVFVGTKMIIKDWYHVPIGLSLGVIALCLAGTILASYVFPAKAEPTGPAPVPTPNESNPAP
jgi:tellurite resistance protein TerC